MVFDSSTYLIIFLLALSAFLAWKIYQLQNKQHPTATKTNGNFSNDQDELDKNKFTEILDRITEGFVSLDKNWNYTFVNQKACELLNKTKEELIGKNIWEIFPDGVGLPFYQAYHNALENQKQLMIEEHYAPFNSWFENYIYPSNDGLSIIFRNITEKKLTEQQIYNEKNLSDSIINSLPGLFYMVDINGKLIRWNKLFENVSGYTKEEITSMRVIDFVDIDQRQEVLSKKASVIQKGESEVESFFITKDKQKIPYFFTSNYSKYKDAPCLLGVGIDISKLKETERQREIEQSNNEALINTTKEMMWSVDRNLRLIAGNKQFLNRIEEVTGALKKYGDSVMIEGFFTTDQLEYWKKLYDRALSGESLVEEFYTPSLEYINKAWSEASLNPIYKNQEIIGAACLVRNTSETKFYENELIKINQRLSTAQNIANLGYWEYNIKTKNTYWSDQTYAIFEIDKNIAEINFRKFLEIVHPDDKSQVLRHKEKLMLGEKVDNLEHRIISSNGHIKIILETITQVYDADNNLIKIEGTSQDISERKKIESELHKLNHELLLLNQANIYFLHAEKEEELLQTICNLLTQQGKYSMAWIGFMPNENSINQKIIPKISAGNNLEYLNEIEIDLADPNLSSGPTGQTMITGNAHFINHISKELNITTWKSKAIKYNFKSAASFPLKIEDKTIASLNIYSELDLAFDQHENKILSRLANNLSFAIKALRNKKEKSETETALQLSNSQYRQLSSHLQSIREEERTSIAREIHDVLGQQMTAFKYDLAWLSKKKTYDDPTILEKIHTMNKSVDETIQSIRKISSELRPRILDDLGLNAAIEWFITSFEKNTGIKCTLNSTLEGLKIEKLKSITIYRILQEALTNVARHSKASSVQINATFLNNEIHLEIQDNGIGITEINHSNFNSLGLLGMNERANMINGVLIINGINNIGTSIVLRVPIESTQIIN